MDWELAIGRNREALKRILVALVAMAGLGPVQDAPKHLPRSLHRACLRLLRPAESAVRRLVIVAARGLSVTLPPLRPRQPKQRPAILRNVKGAGIVMPPGYRGTVPARQPEPTRLPLSLFDTLPRFKPGPRRPVTSGTPRISSFGRDTPFALATPRPPARRPPQPDDPIATARLRLRLEALARALDDLPAEAMRFARWRARGADAAVAQEETCARIAVSRDLAPGPPRRFRRVTPLRPGRPPGSLRRPTHEVHEVLADLNFFAMRALERRDTS